MTSTRSSLPIPGSRVPKKAISASTTKAKTPDLSERTVKSIATVERSGIATPLNSKVRRPEPRRTPLDTSASVKATSLPAAKPLEALKHDVEDKSGSTCSSKVDASSKDCSDDSNTATVSSISADHSSQYNGPQLVEACVGNALLHVLQPCGHRVMTRHVQSCGQNCKGSDSTFANTRTTAKFACAVCISKHVQENYSSKKSLYVSSLDKLENALGGFRSDWKSGRITLMERVWKNDATAERKALEKLGRHCETISTDPEEETVVELDGVAPTKEAPSQVQSSEPSLVEVKTVRRQIPVPKKPKGKSQIPTPSSLPSIEKKAVDIKRGTIRLSRIPAGPKPPRK